MSRSVIRSSQAMQQAMEITLTLKLLVEVPTLNEPLMAARYVVGLLFVGIERA
jgi:hypothetical protein